MAEIAKRYSTPFFLSGQRVEGAPLCRVTQRTLVFTKFAGCGATGVDASLSTAHVYRKPSPGKPRVLFSAPPGAGSPGRLLNLGKQPSMVHDGFPDSLRLRNRKEKLK